MSQQLQNYLSKQLQQKALISEKPEKNLQLIIIIPTFNEPDILKTLHSLKQCEPAPLPTEVIILINHSVAASKTIIEQNKKAYAEVSGWIKNNSSSHLKFHCLIIGDFPEKHAGVGLARKTLMDEAVRQFLYNSNELGIIASLDADSVVSANYISEIQQTFLQQPKLNCAVFQFEHQITAQMDDSNKNAIVLYELYLRYFKLALHSAGFPYAYHTIGSCFAVRALAYAKQGGMSKRQAGEDFYFLHKIFPLGYCIELNHVVVYPSSRPSNRVPFGTGSAVQKIIESNAYLTYNPVYFKHLSKVFNTQKQLYGANAEEILNIYNTFHASIKQFIDCHEFTQKITEVNGNCASQSAFNQRFYQWFDAFKIIKYLNEVHATEPRIGVAEAAKSFLEYCGKKTNYTDAISLLLAFKKLEMSES